MEGRTKLCLLVLLVLLATPATLAGPATVTSPATDANPATVTNPATVAKPATLKEQECVDSRFKSLICMDWSCRMECKDNYPGKIIYDAYCTVKHLVVRYCNCLVCIDK